MESNGLYSRAVAALIRWDCHTDESAVRFLGRCSVEEAKAIAAAENVTEFEDAVKTALDRMERNETRYA